MAMVLGATIRDTRGIQAESTAQGSADPAAPVNPIMPRPALATAATLALALAFGHPWVPAPEPTRVYLPHAAQRIAAPKPTARPVYQPRDVEGLERALGHAGALVVAKGLYKPSGRLWIAPGVTLDGQGRTTILGANLMVEDADGATLRGLVLAGCDGDCVTVKRSRGVVVESARISTAEDGLLDLYGGSQVRAKGVVFHDNTRGVLCGNWQAPNDGRERLTLIDVRFERVRVRTPKAEDCDVYARNLVVIDAVEWPVDARGSSVVILDGYEWSGRKTNPPGWRADDGARVEVR